MSDQTIGGSHTSSRQTLRSSSRDARHEGHTTGCHLDEVMYDRYVIDLAPQEGQVIMCLLTVKLRGREVDSDWSRGRTMPLRARGDTTTRHDTLQRLLGGNTNGLPLIRERKEPFVAVWVVDLDNVIPPP